MHVPKSIKAARFKKKIYDIGSIDNKIKSLEYLNRVMEDIVVSEKYLLRRDFLIVNVKPEADKQKMKLAMENISEGNKVLNITSSNRKPFLKRRISTKSYKRMCIKFEKQFDLSIFSGGAS
jgi:ribosomal protein L23